MFGFSPEFDKNLEESARMSKEHADATKVHTELIKKQQKVVDKTTDALEKNETALNEATEAGKDTTALLKEQAILKTQLKEDKEDLKVRKEDEKEDKKDFDKELFVQMNESLFKISDAEMQRRIDFDKEYEQQKAVLEQAKKNNPAAAMEIDNELKNLEVKRDKDMKDREKQQTNVFAKGFKGIQNSFKGFTKSIKDKGGTVLKSGLLIAAYFAFSKLLQSEMLMDFIKFFSESGFFVKSLIVLTTLITAYMATKGLSYVVRGFLTKLGFLEKGIAKGSMNISKISKSMGVGKKGFFSKGISLLGKGLTSVKGSLLSAGTSLSGKALAGAKALPSIIMGIGPKLLLFGKGILAFVAKGLALINPVFLIGAAIAGIGLLIYNYWDEISAFFGSIGGKLMSALSDIGTKLGNFFGDLFKPVTDLFQRIKNAMAKYYNKVANSALGKFIGMKPMAIQTEDGLPAADIAKASETMSGGEKDPARFVARKQNEDMQMKRKEEMMDEKRAVNVVNNQNVVNNVSQGGNTVQNNATRYVKDQGSVFASNNA
jgi:hypothetical protein